ncbi:conserved exported protein of unknown function [Streptantibioticus cattleyicolor NRRL 8057 = DSM 46488]|nr:conserved exported protein of unknown function [Streptantibioticus cattleyicolor NRRL 8057 = DSM 46488]
MLRTALALSALGTALTAGTATATAAPAEVPGAGDVVGGTLHGLESGVAPVTHLQLDPLARTTVDPLTNGVATKAAGFRPLGTTTVTKPLTDGASLSELPLLGQVAKALPGGR